MERKTKRQLKKANPTKPFRRFLGKLEGFESRQEANFEKKHLEAYLKGQTYFSYGRHQHNGEPRYFPVKFELLNGKQEDTTTREENTGIK